MIKPGVPSPVPYGGMRNRCIRQRVKPTGQSPNPAMLGGEGSANNAHPWKSQSGIGQGSSSRVNVM